MGASRGDIETFDLEEEGYTIMLRISNFHALGLGSWKTL